MIANKEPTKITQQENPRGTRASTQHHLTVPDLISIKQVVIATLSKPSYLIFFAFIFFSTNLFNLNRIYGFQDRNESNLASPRDALQALLLAAILFSPLQRATNSLATCCYAIVALSPFAALLGFLNDAPINAIAKDSFTMSTWLLPLLLATKLKNDRDFFAFAYSSSFYLGLIVACGILVEVLSKGAIQIVTANAEQLSKSIRSVPVGGPFLALASSHCFALLFRRQHKSAFIFAFVSFTGLLLSILLTQTRTLLVGLFAGGGTFLILTFLYTPTRVNWAALASSYSIGIVIILATLAIGEAYIGGGFSKHFLDRYSVFASSEGRSVNFEREGRVIESRHVYEQHISESPILGKGLGVPTWKYEKTTLVHNILLWFWMRYGILGACIWVVFSIASFFAMKSSFDDGSISFLTAQGLTITQLSLVVMALFGNIYTQTYSCQQVMVILALVIALREPNWPHRRTALQPRV